MPEDTFQYNINAYSLHRAIYSVSQNLKKKKDNCCSFLFEDGGWIVAVQGGNRKIFLRGGICQSLPSEEEEVEGTKVDEIEKDGIL